MGVRVIVLKTHSGWKLGRMQNRGFRELLEVSGGTASEEQELG